MKKYIFNKERYNYYKTDKNTYFIKDMIRNKEYEINNSIYLLLIYFKSNNDYDIDKIIKYFGIEIKNVDEKLTVSKLINNFVSFLIERSMIIKNNTINKQNIDNNVNSQNLNERIGDLILLNNLNENSRSCIKLYSKNNKKFLLKFYKSKKYEIGVEKAKYEYKVLCKLKDIDNVVNIFDYKNFGIDNINRNFIILEYIEGCTIFNKILNEKIDETLFINILNQLINCYSNLHNLNILHGDIHPSNVIYSNESIIKIIDFGESIINEKSNKNAGLSFFCPPERLNDISFNKFKHPINKQGEVYQISLLIYFIINKNIPFDATKWSVLVEQIKKWNYKYEQHELLSENLNNKINKILEKGLSHKLDYRYKDIVELQKDWLE